MIEGRFFLTGKSLLVVVKISSRLLDFSAITLANILIRTVLSKKDNVKNIVLSMCDVRVFLTFTSLNLVLR